ncbi:hypothetical protein SPAN111604_13990 [Sphingomonas antarctica]
MRGGAVILFEADDLCAREILFELEDVFDLRAAPGIDRLVVVADAAQILAALREQAQPEILDGVGVLIFVDHYVAKALLIHLQHVAMFLQDHQHVEEQIAEVAGVKRLQPRLILRVELAAAAIGEALAFARIDITRGEAAVLPIVDHAREAPRRPALFVEIGGDDQLLHHAQLVVGVEYGEVGLQPGKLGVAAQHLRADRVKRTEPGHALHRIADQAADALAHLPRRLVGEGDAEDFRRVCFPRVDEVREAGGQRGGLAGAGAGEDQDRAIRGEYGLTLRRVEAAQIGGVGHDVGGGAHPKQLGNMMVARNHQALTPLATGESPSPGGRRIRARATA